MEDRDLIDIVIDVLCVGAAIVTTLLTVSLAGVLVMRAVETVQ